MKQQLAREGDSVSRTPKETQKRGFTGQNISHTFTCYVQS
jgi:hypothetical protein